VTWHLKGRIVEPEEMVLSRQRLDKHVSTALDTRNNRRTVVSDVFCAVRAKAI
jgi:hypothetical protein